MTNQVIADVDGSVFAYTQQGDISTGDLLLIVVRHPQASPFGSAMAPIRRMMETNCTTLGYQGPHIFKERADSPAPEWARGGELTIHKVWQRCPPYEHDCVEVKASDVS